MLGLRYNPRQVHFEPLPDEVLAHCPELSNERWGRRAWMFAHLEVQGHAYYVIGGLYVAQKGAGKVASKTLPDPLGAVLDLNQDQCDLLGPAGEVFDSRPQEMPQSALDSLADEALRRYETAFGGRSALRAAMRAQGIVPEHMQGAWPGAFERAGW